MKKIIKLGMIGFLAIAVSCQDELDVPLTQLTTSDVVPNAAFVETLVVGVYAGMLSEGWGDGETGTIYSNIASDDAYKGSDANDQSDMTQTEIGNVLPSNGFLNSRWGKIYDGIARANAAILVVNAAIENGDLTVEQSNQPLGELLFMRAHLHFEAKQMFGNIPFIDETVEVAPSNTIDAWPLIEADMTQAISLLSTESVAAGRANQWTAKSYMAKIHMYQLDYIAAKPILDDIMLAGPYSLNASFHDNFDAATNNSSESIFAVQYAINDGEGAGQGNARYADVLNFPHSNSPFGCCGFQQPTHDLVNAYLVDPATGLPLATPISDPADYVKSVDPADTIGTAADGSPIPRNADDDTFVPDTRPLDPRLDWTVGRKGIPFLGWGDFAGLLWVRDAPNGGEFMSKKHVWENDQDGTGGQTGNWGQKLSAVSHNVIRYAEIILWRAEIAASEGDLGNAAMLVDQIRARAANPDTWVKRDDGSDAANYQLGLYMDNGGFASIAEAEAAVLNEYRLEMAIEGKRFFDLARRGILQETLNAYISRPQFRSYLQGASFAAGRDIYPIPEGILDLSNGAFTQNPGY